MDYVAAQKVRTHAIDIVANLFRKVDLIVTPTFGVLAPQIPDEFTSDAVQTTNIIRFVRK